MLKKYVYVIFLLVFVLTFASNFGSAEETIDFQGWIAMEESGEEAWDIMKTTFEEENPELNIKYIGTPWAQMLQQVTVSARGGNPPDVAQLNAPWMVQLADMGVLEPLNKYFTDEELARIPDAVLEAGSYNGKLYSIPWAPGPIVLFGRKDLIEKAGFDAEKGPQTWEEFEEMVTKITELKTTEEGSRIYGFGMRTVKDPNTGQWFLPILWAYGGQILNDDQEVVFNSPETIEALTWVQELADNRAIREGTNSTMSRNLFTNGQAAFIFDGPWFRGIYRAKSEKGKEADKEYKAYVMPPGVSGESKSIANNHVLVMFKDSENKEQAIKFIKHLTQNDEIVTMYREEVGLLAPHKDQLELPEFKEDTVYVEQMKNSNAVPIKVPEINQVLEEVAVAVQKSILGQDPGKAAKDAEDKIEQIINE